MKAKKETKKENERKERHHTMSQVHTGACGSLLAPEKAECTARHPRKTTTCILHVEPVTTHTTDASQLDKKKQRKEDKGKNREESKKRKINAKKGQDKNSNKGQDQKRKQGEEKRKIVMLLIADHSEKIKTALGS